MRTFQPCPLCSMRCHTLCPLRLAAAALLLATTILLATTMPCAAQAAPAPGDIVVNEILYDPPPEAAPGEYVELLNRSGQAFDLANFEIADGRDEPVPVTSDSQTLAPGERAVLVQDGEAFAAVFPEVRFIELGSWPQLNNGGDTARLLFEGTVIDAVPYEPSWGGEDRALERIDPAGPSDDAENFGNSTAEVGTPGAENTLAGNGGEDDTTPPVLDTVRVATNRAMLTAVFSEPLAPASVAAEGFALEAASGAAPTVTSASPVEGEPASRGRARAGRTRARGRNRAGRVHARRRRSARRSGQRALGKGAPPSPWRRGPCPIRATWSSTSCGTPRPILRLSSSRCSTALTNRST